jgi:hypothetical protein
MARPHGQIRQSQIITTFGPGALVDLPRHAAIVAGLETWRWGGDDRKREVHEPRLVAKIERALNVPGLKLYEPPADDPEPGAPLAALQYTNFRSGSWPHCSCEGPTVSVHDPWCTGKR